MTRRSSGPEREMQGWYRADNDTAPLRVRLSVEDRSLNLHSLAGALVARWSLDHLENRTVPIFGRDWIIGDRRLPGTAVTVENDRDYAELGAAATGLLPLRERTWRQFFFAAQESGNLTGWPVLVPIMVGILAVAALWFMLA